MNDTPPAIPQFFDFHAFVCCNRRPDGHARGSCAAKGAEKLRDYMKACAKEQGIERARINSSGCLDRCELGPCVVIYPRGDWFRIETTEDIDRVLAAAQPGGAPADDLRLPNR